MKKLILLTIILILSQLFLFAYAEENDVLNLHSNNSYILELNTRPFDVQITNPRIIKTEITTDLYTNNSQLILTTIQEGISYVSYKTNNIIRTIKILVDNQAPITQTVIEIDKPME